VGKHNLQTLANRKGEVKQHVGFWMRGETEGGSTRLAKTLFFAGESFELLTEIRGFLGSIRGGERGAGEPTRLMKKERMFDRDKVTRHTRNWELASMGSPKAVQGGGFNSF